MKTCSAALRKLKCCATVRNPFSRKFSSCATPHIIHTSAESRYPGFVPRACLARQSKDSHARHNTHTTAELGARLKSIGTEPLEVALRQKRILTGLLPLARLGLVVAGIAWARQPPSTPAVPAKPAATPGPPNNVRTAFKWKRFDYT